MTIASELGLDLHESVLGDDWELIQLIMESRLGNLSVVQPKMIRLLSDRYGNRSRGLVGAIGASSPVEPITDFKMGDLEKILDRSTVLILSYGGNQIFAISKVPAGPGGYGQQTRFIHTFDWRNIFSGLNGIPEAMELLDKLDKVVYSTRTALSRLKELVKVLIKLSDIEDRQLTLLSIGKDPEIVSKGKERKAARMGMIPRERSRQDRFDRTGGQYTTRGAYFALLDRLDRFKKSRVGLHIKDPAEMIEAMMTGGFFLNVKVGDHIYELVGTEGNVTDTMKLKDAPGTVGSPRTPPSKSIYSGFRLRYRLPDDVRSELMHKYYSIKDESERDRYSATLPPFEFKVYLGSKGGTIVPTDVQISDERSFF